MLKLLTAQLCVEVPDTFTDEDCDRIIKQLEEIQLLDKLFGAAREMIRGIKEHHQIFITLE